MANNSIGAYAQGGLNEIGAYEYVAAGGDISITTGAPDSLSFTGAAPVTILPRFIQTGTPDSLSFTGAVPVMAQTAHHVIQMGTGALNFTGYTPNSEGGDGKLGGLTAGLYSATGAIIRLGRIGRP